LQMSRSRSRSIWTSGWEAAVFFSGCCLSSEDGDAYQFLRSFRIFFFKKTKVQSHYFAFVQYNWQKLGWTLNLSNLPEMYTAGPCLTVLWNCVLRLIACSWSWCSNSFWISFMLAAHYIPRDMLPCSSARSTLTPLHDVVVPPNVLLAAK
jgi:hypothetical protein